MVFMFQFERMSTNVVFESGRQICDALIFLHDQHFVHTYITSHAVFLTNTHTIKIGNFEHMVERYDLWSLVFDHIDYV